MSSARVVDKESLIMPDPDAGEYDVRSAGSSMLMCPKCGEIIVAELFVRIEDDDDE